VAAESQQILLTQEAELARSNEAKLRRQAEARERITQAEIMVSQGRFNEADTMISEASLTGPSMEDAALLRSLGEWHALQGRWTQAVDRLNMLLQVNQLDGWSRGTLDFFSCGVCLIESGGADRYDRFSQATLSRFVSTSNAVAAERTIKACLLKAPSQGVMESLAPLAHLAEEAFTTTGSHDEDADFCAAWGSVSLSLWEYRRGHFAESIKWARHCLAYPEYNAPRAATAHLELALALSHTGQMDEALRELSEGRQPIENKFNEVLEPGSPAEGFWFDWVFARILLREASK
jgi:tetratricopeptide (TPR) repeat protein